MRARHVLANVAPWVLRILLGDSEARDRKPAGSQLKINFLLSRLPKLKSGHDPEEAFAGTFHVAEEYSALERSYREASGGSIPADPPGEFYCHSLTDPSILGDLAGQGVHTLTYFGLHMPEALFATDRAGQRDEAVRRAIAAVDVHLAEPLMDCVLTGPDGKPCIEAKVPQDVEDDLAMPGGHIFHGDLEWPWAGEPPDPRHPRPAVGRRHRLRRRPAVRFGRPPRRRGERSGRPQRRPGSARQQVIDRTPTRFRAVRRDC